MSDIAHHSQGLWRTFVLYDNKNLLKILQYLTINNVRHSFQNYGASDIEPAHISIRLEFTSLIALEDFRHFLTELGETITETSWDEPQWVKRAYEFGTTMWKLLQTFNLLQLGIDEDSFLVMAFHGFFNDLNYGYSDEAQFYMKGLTKIFPYALKPGWK